MKLHARILLLSLVAGITAGAAITENNFTTCSLLGGATDSVCGARIQSNGSIVLAANVSAGPMAASARGATAGKGMVVRLTPVGTRLLSARRVADEVRDLALDAQDNIYVACGREGAIKLDPTAGKELWKQPAESICVRVDATADGTCALLNYSTDDDSTPGAGRVLVLDANGHPLGSFNGRHNTIDVAVDGRSKTVVTIGWRQANAFDGQRKQPVQISHLTGRSYEGTAKYHLYDWSVTPEAPDFLNQPSNNMADTRGYRCAMGADGKLYTAFECAGGNHIFRFEPRLVNGAWVEAQGKKAQGDKYHAFYNSRAEHKTFVAQFDPATGEYLRGQEFTGRLSSGRANAVRVKNGTIAAGAEGCLFVGGTAASGLPVSFTPPGTGDYTGGGFLLGLNPALDTRLFCLRLQPGAVTHAVDVRQVNGKTVVVCGGSTSTKPEPFWTPNAIQSEAPPNSGFFAVFTME